MASLVKPMRFRFLAAQDIEQYGEGWWVYDESVITSLSARSLMRLELEIGAPIVDVMTGFRASSAFGDMAAAWLAIKVTDPKAAPAFADFNPHSMLMEWEAVPAEDLEPGKGEADSGTIPEPAAEPQLEPGGSPDWQGSVAALPLDESQLEGTWPTATVSLPIMPVAGSHSWPER